jgi:hypothetical protein
MYVLIAHKSFWLYISLSQGNAAFRGMNFRQVHAEINFAYNYHLSFIYAHAFPIVLYLLCR